MKPKINNAVE